MDLLVAYAMSFLGLPYLWGGENPMTGFDCSGLVQELLQSVGIDPSGDQSAQALHDLLMPTARSMTGRQKGALAFYGRSVREITHVAFLIDEYRVIEAGGGGRLITDEKKAAAASAFVRMRPLEHRADLVALLMPKYPVWVVCHTS